MSQGSTSLDPTLTPKMSALIIQQPVILPAKVGLFGNSQGNCNSGNASNGRPWANPGNKEGELTFIRKKRKLREAIIAK